MPDITIYHNGECTKCKGALEMLQERNIPHQVRFYLAEPLSKEEVKDILQKLGITAHNLARTGEPLYKELFEGKELSEEEWINVLVENPILIQRPIVVKGEKAIIARPPERISEIID